MLNIRTLTDANGSKVWATAEQAETINTLMDTRKGGFARVYGYVATSKRIVPSVYDATFSTRFSYSKLIQRQKSAIEAITVQDILDRAGNNPKLAKLSATELESILDARKAMEIGSIEKTLSGERDDAYRAAHDRCYLNLTDGVIVHYATDKGDDGLMHPILENGFPIVDSIMLNVLELSRNVREAGEYKTINSGAPVIVSNIIKAIMKERGVRKMSRISLKEGKFERLAIDGDVILPEDCIALLD